MIMILCPPKGPSGGLVFPSLSEFSTVIVIHTVKGFGTLTCLLRNLYTGQEATVRTGHGTTDWFQIEYVKDVYCHPTYLTYMQSTS